MTKIKFKIACDISFSIFQGINAFDFTIFVSFPPPAAYDKTINFTFQVFFAKIISSADSHFL